MKGFCILKTVLFRLWARWIADERGMSAMEYGLIISGTALLVSFGVFNFADSFVGLLGNLTNAFNEIIALPGLGG